MRVVYVTSTAWHPRAAGKPLLERCGPRRSMSSPRPTFGSGVTSLADTDSPRYPAIVTCGRLERTRGRYRFLFVPRCPSVLPAELRDAICTGDFRRVQEPISRPLVEVHALAGKGFSLVPMTMPFGVPEEAAIDGNRHRDAVALSLGEQRTKPTHPDEHARGAEQLDGDRHQQGV